MGSNSLRTGKQLLDYPLQPIQCPPQFPPPVSIHSTLAGSYQSWKSSVGERFWMMISPPQEVNVCGLAQVSGRGRGQVGKANTQNSLRLAILEAQPFVQLVTRIHLEGKNSLEYS